MLLKKCSEKRKKKKTNNRGLGKAIGIGSGLAVASHLLQQPTELVAAYGKDGLKDLANKKVIGELMKDRFASRQGIASLAGKLAAGTGIAAAGYKIGKNKNKEKD